MIEPEEIWNRYFCPEVEGRPTREYLSATVLPKPRDLIYLAKAALALAVNRKHARIQETDILDAVKQYSRYALDALLVENFLRIENLEELLYEFAGGPSILKKEAIQAAVERCRVNTPADDLIDALVEGMFLGQEIATGEFAYLYNENDKLKLASMARKTASETGAIQFQINIPFRSYLEIQL